MKTKWISKAIKYDGSQLRPLYCYLDHGLLGDAIVAFRGSCDVTFEHMVDGEDLIQKALIQGGDMIHFVCEIFASELLGGVAIQRLLTNIVREVIWGLAGSHHGQLPIARRGDDLFVGEGKLTISIATKSANSLLIHFGINVSNNGTPVKTACLQDLGIDPIALAEQVLNKFSLEFISMREASWKVKPLS